MAERAADAATGVYTYTTKWPVYAVAWSHHRAYSKPRLAIGSSLDEHTNKVELIQFDPDTLDFSTDIRLVLDHPYAPTNIMFVPSEANASSSSTELLATSGDFLRLWDVHQDHVEMRTLLNSNRGSEFSSAITSFDWASVDPRRIVVCSIDTTCTVWDVEREAVDAQLVAHDKAVYDVSWGGVGVFASVSGDGSVRVFDLRDKERSTIIYENVTTAPNNKDHHSPILRLEWNKADPRFMATVGMDSSTVVVLDIRYPTAPVAGLNKHRGSVNAVSWAPQVGRLLCSVGDDGSALIWDVLQIGLPGSDGGMFSEMEPEMWYGCTSAINNSRWSPVEMDWIALTTSNQLQLLRV